MNDRLLYMPQLHKCIPLVYVSMPHPVHFSTTSIGVCAYFFGGGALTCDFDVSLPTWPTNVTGGKGGEVGFT